METFQLAERTLAVHMTNSVLGQVSPAVSCGELRQREAEARLFHCCQSTSVETVTELTEFAKAMPGFQSLDLNDQVGFRLPSMVRSGRKSRWVFTCYCFSIYLLGDSLEVRCLRSPLHTLGLVHEQGRPPGGPWWRLYHPWVPQESPPTIQWHDGAQIPVCHTLQLSGAGRQRPSSFCGCYYLLWR